MSFSISSRSEPLTQRLFVEASAGTGKTYVIEHYLVRSILTSPFNPEKLALITFTKAVARELRQRLRTTLQTTLAFVVEAGRGGSFPPPATSCHSRDSTCVGDTPLACHTEGDGILGQRSATIPDYLQAVLEQDGFCRGEVARTLEGALERLSGAMITTIHGFCDKLLKRWGEESGSGCFEEWVGEEEQKQWLIEFLGEGGGLRGGELEVISKKYWHDQDRLLTHLVKLINDSEGKEDTAWEAAEVSAAVVRKKVGAMDVASVLAAKAKNYRGNMRKDGTLRNDVARAFDAIQKIIENGVEEGSVEALFDFSLPNCFAQLLVKNQALGIEEEALVNSIVEELWPSLQELVDSDCIVRRLAERSANAFVAFVNSRGKKTPEMVVRRVLELSCNERFLACAAAAVEWLVVDEFQDTDAIQYTIFSRLFLDNPLWQGHVLFVGDPKQAIYGFRKADVYSYLAAKSALLPHETRTLAVNYRAASDVIDAQNRLFAGPEHPWVFFLPRLSTSLTVVPCGVGQKEQLAIDDDRGALHLVVASSSLGRRRRWPHDELEQQELFPWLADEMISLERRGIAFRRQAILVKDRHQAKRVQQFLICRGIPTCAWRVDALTDSPIYLWLQKAMSLAIRPYEARRLSALLLTLPNEYHLEICRAMAADRRLDQWAACAAAWSSVRDAFQDGGIARMARVLFSCRWNGRDTVEEWLHAMPQGDDLLIDLEHLFELLSLLDPVLPHSLEAYGDALAHITGHFSDEMEALIRRGNPDDDGCPILTMHRSKGLEFDVVYALGCASRTPIQDDIAVDEADAEKLRQLYVAVTRAKRRCYLPLLIDTDEKAIPVGHASPVELLFAALSSKGSPSAAWTSDLYQAMNGASRRSLAATLCYELPHAFTMSTSASEQRSLFADKKKKAPPPAHCQSTPCYSSRMYHSFSQGQDVCPQRARWDTASMLSMADAKDAVVAAQPLLMAAAPDKGGKGVGGSLSPTLFGVRFHEAIAQLLFAPADARQSADAVEEWLKSHGKGDKEMALLLYNALRVRLPMGGDEVCLEDIPRNDMRAECSFLDKEDGERYVQGVLDLVVLWKEAVYVIDWKTHVVDGGRCQKVVEDGYELQHRLYMQAVVKAFAPDFRYGGFFFIFVRHLGDGGIVYAGV